MSVTGSTNNFVIQQKPVSFLACFMFHLSGQIYKVTERVMCVPHGIVISRAEITFLTILCLVYVAHIVVLRRVACAPL